MHISGFGLLGKRLWTTIRSQASSRGRRPARCPPAAMLARDLQMRRAAPPAGFHDLCQLAATAVLSGRLALPRSRSRAPPARRVPNPFKVRGEGFEPSCASAAPPPLSSNAIARSEADRGRLLQGSQTLSITGDG